MKYRTAEMNEALQLKRRASLFLKGYKFTYKASKCFRTKQTCLTVAGNFVVLSTDHDPNRAYLQVSPRGLHFSPRIKHESHEAPFMLPGDVTFIYWYHKTNPLFDVSSFSGIISEPLWPVLIVNFTRREITAE